jgi:hypothetical protein
MIFYLDFLGGIFFIGNLSMQRREVHCAEIELLVVVSSTRPFHFSNQNSSIMKRLVFWINAFDAGRHTFRVPCFQYFAIVSLKFRLFCFKSSLVNNETKYVLCFAINNFDAGHHAFRFPCNDGRFGQYCRCVPWSANPRASEWRVLYLHYYTRFIFLTRNSSSKKVDVYIEGISCSPLALCSDETAHQAVAIYIMQSSDAIRLAETFIDLLWDLSPAAVKQQAGGPIWPELSRAHRDSVSWRQGAAAHLSQMCSDHGCGFLASFNQHVQLFLCIFTAWLTRRPLLATRVAPLLDFLQNQAKDIIQSTQATGTSKIVSIPDWRRRPKVTDFADDLCIRGIDLFANLPVTYGWRLGLSTRRQLLHLSAAESRIWDSMFQLAQRSFMLRPAGIAAAAALNSAARRALPLSSAAASASTTALSSSLTAPLSAPAFTTTLEDIASPSVSSSSSSSLALFASVASTRSSSTSDRSASNGTHFHSSFEEL